MKRYLIERSVPGGLTGAALAEFARKSNIAIASLGVPYRWIHSYVAGERLYCIHEAEDEGVVREQLRRCGIAVTSVTAVSDELDPQSGK
ncbi:DUF4242 domain-containing protein [Mycolicibacterium phlei]